VDYPALYLALDAAFIVDADHFITPDLRGRVIVALATAQGCRRMQSVQPGGEEKHALSQIEGPSHSHELTDPGHTHTPAAGTSVFCWTHGRRCNRLGAGDCWRNLQAGCSDSKSSNRNKYGVQWFKRAA